MDLFREGCAVPRSARPPLRTGYGRNDRLGVRFDGQGCKRLFHVELLGLEHRGVKTGPDQGGGCEGRTDLLREGCASPPLRCGLATVEMTVGSGGLVCWDGAVAACSMWNIAGQVRPRPMRGIGPSGFIRSLHPPPCHGQARSGNEALAKGLWGWLSGWVVVQACSMWNTWAVRFTGYSLQGERRGQEASCRGARISALYPHRNVPETGFGRGDPWGKGCRDGALKKCSMWNTWTWAVAGKEVSRS